MPRPEPVECKTLLHKRHGSRMHPSAPVLHPIRLLACHAVAHSVVSDALAVSGGVGLQPWAAATTTAQQRLDAGGTGGGGSGSSTTSGTTEGDVLHGQGNRLADTSVIDAGMMAW